MGTSFLYQSRLVGSQLDDGQMLWLDVLGAKCYNQIPVNWYKDNDEPYMVQHMNQMQNQIVVLQRIYRILIRIFQFFFILMKQKQLFLKQNVTLMIIILIKMAPKDKDIVYDQLDKIFKQYCLFQSFQQQIAPTLGDVSQQKLIILLDQWHLAVDTQLNTYCHFTSHKLDMVNWKLDPLQDVQEDKVKI